MIEIEQSSVGSDFEQPHLTADELNHLLKFVSDCKPILIGGQAINIWATLLEGQDPELDDLGPLTSADVDFFRNKDAQKALMNGLQSGQLILPTGDDSTPNAAVVTGYIGDKKVVIDFMAAIKGVKDEALLKKSITIADSEDPNSVSITLMHPIDCLRSRLANINDLGRVSEHSINQAAASVRILDVYIENAISDSETTHQALDCLRELEYIITQRHIGKTSHLDFADRLDLQPLLTSRLDDDRLDSRWRTKTLDRIIDRVNIKLRKHDERVVRRSSRLTTVRRRV